MPDLEERWFQIYGKVALTGESVRFMEGSEQMNRWFDVYAIRVGPAEEKKVALMFRDVMRAHPHRTGIARGGPAQG